MGETEKGADRLDKEIWGDDEEKDADDEGNFMIQLLCYIMNCHFEDLSSDCECSIAWSTQNITV